MALGNRAGVPAALGQAPAPLPAQGRHLGDRLFHLVGVLQAAEVDAAVTLDPGQDDRNAA